MPSPDEAGFLSVGAQWQPGGTSLYGDYWVDRPPLLITIFRLAAELGGLVPLRLVGCLATLLAVLGSPTRPACWRVRERRAGGPWSRVPCASVR